MQHPHHASRAFVPGAGPFFNPFFFSASPLLPFLLPFSILFPVFLETEMSGMTSITHSINAKKEIRWKAWPVCTTVRSQFWRR